MNILICTQTVDKNDPVLGFFHNWIKEFAKHCEAVTVICLREGKHELPPNVRVRSLGKEKGRRSRVVYVLKFWYFCLRHLFSYKAVFIHMNHEYAVLGWLIWKLAGKRRVLWYTHKSTPLLLRLASRIVDTICTASAESFRLKRENVVVTGHGIDTEVFSAPRAKPVDFMRIVTVGRVSRSKKIGTMLKAMPLLPKNGVAYRFTIVGTPITADDQKYQQELWDKIEELHIGDFSGFAGPKEASEIPDILAASDIFLHASDTGSLDKAMLEAMSERCVVISSNDAAKPILNAVQDGLAVEKTDPELFARAITRVYEMGIDARIKIGERSRVLVEQEHSLTKLIEKLIWILNGNK